MNKYLSLARAYPVLLPIVGFQHVTLKLYLSSWTSVNQKGLLTSAENITFDGF